MLTNDRIIKQNQVLICVSQLETMIFLGFSSSSLRQISEEDKTPATRVSEFRARFEKFGSSKSKKGGSFEEEGKRSDRDAQEICRELQKQLNELENQREGERASLVEKMEKQRSDSDREIQQLRERNSVVSVIAM